MRYGMYVVTGKREYLGHKPGTEFPARLDRYAERRAIDRGDIAFLGEYIPTIDPALLEFPDGWLASQIPTRPSRRRKAPLSLGKE